MFDKEKQNIFLKQTKLAKKKTIVTTIKAQ